MDELQFSASGGTATLTRYSGRAESVKIPEIWNGLPVTRIGPGAFSMCRTLLSVVLPSTLKEIGDHAFAWCSNLIRVRLPLGMRSLGAYAFLDCPKLCYFSIPVRITSLPEGVFSGCSDLRRLFSYSVTEIGERALYMCSALNELKLCSPVEKLGSMAFYGVPNDFELPGDEFECANGGIYRRGAEGKTLVSFFNTGVERPVLSDELTAIADGAFSMCFNIKSIALPKSLLHVGSRAFAECRGLTELSIQESTRIRPDAFCGCHSLSEVTLNSHGGSTVYHLPRHVTPELHERFCTCISEKFMGYDGLFSCYDNAEEKARAAVARLRYPLRLLESSRAMYTDYVKENLPLVLTQLCQSDDVNSFAFLAGLGMINKANIDELIAAAIGRGHHQSLAWLLQHKSARFGFSETELTL